jgi:hypothetical protein
MKFIPESQQRELPRVEVTSERGHTFTKTIYPEKQPAEDRDYLDYFDEDE